MDRPYSKLPALTSPANVFIATPIAKNGLIQVQTAAYCSMLNQHPSVRWGYINSLSPEFSRNSLLEHHFHNDPCWTHVFFIDSDVVPPENALALLMALDADIAVGLYPIYVDRKLMWCVEKDKGWISMTEPLPEKPFEIKSCGGGCLLVRREVLVDMEWPWFKTDYQEIFKNRGVGIKQGEDVYFIKKAIAKGYKAIAHPQVKCRHFNTIDLLEYFGACNERLDNDTDGTKG